MAEQRDIARGRRLARKKGFLLHKIPDGGPGNFDVLECEIHGGHCKATRWDMQHGHWRAHFTAASGDLAEVIRFLTTYVPDTQ